MASNSFNFFGIRIILVNIVFWTPELIFLVNQLELYLLLRNSTQERGIYWNYSDSNEIDWIWQQKAIFWLFHKNSPKNWVLVSNSLNFNEIRIIPGNIMFGHKNAFFCEVTWILPISQKLDRRTWYLLELFWFKQNWLNLTPKSNILVISRKFTKTALWCPIRWISLKLG